MWKLPIIFVCENNSLKAQGVANKGYPTLIHAAQNLSRIPESLGISCCRLTDGADIASVYAATAAARVACRSGAGPFFIEALTVRWPGSQTVIPTLTSSTNLNAALEGPKVQDSADDWSADHDPLLRWIAELVSKNISTRDDVLARDAAVESQISAALQFALDSPLPDVHSAAKGVFA
jgi:TPP-dependent pyruvate/acetoin dehydrogenase alpha subunit